MHIFSEFFFNKKVKKINILNKNNGCPLFNFLLNLQKYYYFNFIIVINLKIKLDNKIISLKFFNKKVKKINILNKNNGCPLFNFLLNLQKYYYFNFIIVINLKIKLDNKIISLKFFNKKVKKINILNKNNGNNF